MRSTKTIKCGKKSLSDLREEWTREIDLVVSHLADERIRGQLRECLQRRRKQLRDDAKKADAKA